MLHYRVVSHSHTRPRQDRNGPAMTEFWEVVGVPRSDADRAPINYATSGTWPEVTLGPGAPVSAHFARAFVRRLDTALADTGLSGRAVAGIAGVAHTTVQRVLRGEVLPDLGTIARLEVALGVDLYPAGLRAAFTSVKPAERS